MKKLVSLILLFVSSIVTALAQDSPATDFTYEPYKTDEIQIKSYIGQDSVIRVPSCIEDKEVTRINALLSSSNSIVKEIYIPGSIKELYNLIYSASSIKSIIIGKENFTTGTYLMNLNSSTSSFDNIIVLGKCSYDGPKLTSITNGMAKLSRIKVTAEGEPFPIQMYIYTKSKLGTTFENTRFDYLLSALQFQGYNLQDIKKIDFSSLSSGNEVTFNFTNYNPAVFLNPEAQVVIDGQTTYSSGTWIISDDKSFTAPRFDANTTINYSRTNTHDWNSVCLPFPIKESDFPENTKIYTMTGGSNEQISLTRIAEGEELPAGTPCFIYSVANTWDLSIQATIPGKITPVLVTQEGNSWNLCGSFTKQLLDEYNYKLNSNGTAFVQTTSSSHVYPFRCFIQAKNSTGAPARLSVDIDDEASITLVPNDAEPQTVKLYDLMGRPRQGNASGLFIRGKH